MFEFRLTGLQLTDLKPTRWRPIGAPPILHVLCKSANRGSSVNTSSSFYVSLLKKTGIIDSGCIYTDLFMMT